MGTREDYPEMRRLDHRIFITRKENDSFNVIVIDPDGEISSLKGLGSYKDADNWANQIIAHQIDATSGEVDIAALLKEMIEAGHSDWVTTIIELQHQHGLGLAQSRQAFAELLQIFNEQQTLAQQWEQIARESIGAAQKAEQIAREATQKSIDTLGRLQNENPVHLGRGPHTFGRIRNRE